MEDSVIGHGITRRGVLRLAMASGALAAVSACGGGGGGSPEISTAPGAEQGLGADFDQLVAAAKAEGQLQVNTLVGDPYADMVTAFGTKYGIEVQVTQGRVADLATQVLSERSAGKYTVDAWYQTWSVMVSTLLPAGALLPVPPALVRDDVTDGANWKGGTLRYLDDQQQFLPTIGQLPALIYTVNTDNVPEAARPQTLDDLLKFPGRTGLALPGQSGDEVLLWLVNTGHDDFLRQLAAQRPTKIADLNQAFLDLARGNYDLLIGGTEPRLSPVMNEGLPVWPSSSLPGEPKTAGLITYSATTPALAANASHPNAAKLFVNWIMSAEGGTLASKAGGIESARADVPPTGLRPHQLTDPAAVAAGRYQSQDLEMVNKQQAQRQSLASIFNY